MSIKKLNQKESRHTPLCSKENLTSHKNLWLRNFHHCRRVIPSPHLFNPHYYCRKIQTKRFDVTNFVRQFVMSELKDSAIKLFGKTIQLLHIDDDDVVLGKADDQQQQQQQQCSSSEDIKVL